MKLSHQRSCAGQPDGIFSIAEPHVTHVHDSQHLCSLMSKSSNDKRNAWRGSRRGAKGEGGRGEGGGGAGSREGGVGRGAAAPVRKRNLEGVQAWS